jgi:hypothetical protein
VEEHSYGEDLLFGAAQLMVIWKHIANQIPEVDPSAPCTIWFFPHII